MFEQSDRRSFIKQATMRSTAALVLAGSQVGVAAAASDKIVLGVMGLSRGRNLATGFARLPAVEIKYVCDVDAHRADACAALVEKTGAHRPTPIGDFRRILDDKAVDGLVCAAPNHWHAPATILACGAGKHVYVEKPCSHNPREGEMMVEAARRYNRAVQMGNQRRSSPGAMEAMQKLGEGVIGRVYLAKAWLSGGRGSIGNGKPAVVPPQLDFELWQGPAPRRPYVDNLVHYNWHWRWHWGNGELGNNGVHSLDLCRWGMNVQYPTRVTSSGGRYHHVGDDQQTPDTHTVCFEFEDNRQITWEGHSCNRHKSAFVTFFGDAGSLELDSNGTHRVFDQADKLVDETQRADRGDAVHLNNFLGAIRNDKPLDCNSEITEGYRSTLLCHLGNIAQRTGRTLNCDPKNGHILQDAEAMEFWTRQYESGWEPKI